MCKEGDAIEQGEVFRSVRLEDEKVCAILDRLDAGETPAEMDLFAVQKYSYRAQAILVRLTQPGSMQETKYRVPTRTISRDAFCFLHGGYVHLDSQCAIELVDQEGSRHEISGRVVRCAYVQAGVHEVAVAFDAPIDPSGFCEASA